MATIRLSSKSIGSDKTFTTFDIGGELVTQEVISIPLESEIDSTFEGAVTKISFATPTGELSDNQYATQPNGFHWVKISGYKLIKIDPKFITKNVLSQEGITFIQTQSEAE